LGMSKMQTMLLLLQLDGMVECYIKTVKKHLWKVIASHETDWEVRLPLFLLAYRASTQNATSLTPASLVFR
jgi:hypothetical protein